MKKANIYQTVTNNTLAAMENGVIRWKYSNVNLPAWYAVSLIKSRHGLKEIVMIGPFI